jgi:hypothetical protein
MTCVLDVVVVDETTCGVEIELGLIVLLAEVEVNTERILFCVDESWLGAVSVRGVLVNETTRVENEAVLSVEESTRELEETAVGGVSWPGL